MKKIKNLFVLTLCFTFMITTVDVYSSYTNYEVSPLGHTPHIGEKK